MWKRVLGAVGRTLSRPGKPRRRPARLRVSELEDRAVPATFQVTTLNDAGPGSLRQAVLDANADAAADDIQFIGAGAAGTITLSTGQIAITNPVTIAGPGAAALTVTGNNASRIFQIQTTPGGGPGGTGVPVTISGLTLTAGNASPGNTGGAIFSQYANLTVADSILTGNHASSRGGAIFSGYSNARLTVRNSTITGNSAVNFGGAIYSRGYAGTVIENTTISNNQAPSGGGGIYLTSSPLEVRDSTVANNQASGGRGGGLLLTSSSLQMRNSTLSGNTSISYGGGMYQQFGGTSVIEGSTISGNRVTGIGGAAWFGNTTIEVRNSTVSGNSSSGSGGGFYFNSSPPTVRNSTIAHNTAGSLGGGVVFLNIVATVESSIVANNRAPTSPTTEDVYNGHILNATRSLFRVTPGGNGINGTNTANLTGVDPQLGPLQNNGGPTLTHGIPSTSPAVDAGSNSTGLLVDQRGTGFARAENALPDMGAVEWDTALVTNTDDAGPGSLRAAIAAANTEPDFTPVRFADGVTGTITLTTGDVTSSQPIDLQGPGTAALTVTGDAANRFLVGGGFPLSASGLTLVNPDGITVESALTSTGDLALNAGTGNVSFAAPLTVGPGTLTVTDGNGVDLGPATTLAGGTLSAASGFALGLGETLSGAGTVTGRLDVAGGIHPGPGAGTITVNGNLQLQPGGVLDAEFTGSAAYDRLVVNGTVDLGTSIGNLNTFFGFSPPAGTAFTLVANDGTDPVGGRLNGIPNRAPVTIAGVLYQVQYDGGDGNDVVLVANAAPVLNPAVTTNLNPITEDTPPGANPGTTVDDLLGTGVYADAAGTARPGLAVTGASTANGTWQFTLNGGASWTAFGTVSSSSATVLAADGAGQARVRFLPAANFAGTATIAFRGWDGLDGSAGGATGVDTAAAGGHGPFSTQTETALIHVIATNDNPTAVNDAATATEDGGAQAIDVLANDTGAEPGETLSVSSVTQGRHGTVTITGGGTGLTYTPDPDYAGPDTFFYWLSDGSGGSVSAAVTVTVADDAADRLEVVTTPTPQTFTEGQGPVLLFPAEDDLRIGTADEGTITLATVRFARGYVPKKDILTYTAPTGLLIKGVFSPATGTLTLTGAASPDDYERALHAVRYTNPSAAPVAGTRAINIRVQDSAGLGEPATRLLRVVAVNSPPRLTLPGPALTYTRGRPAVAVATTLTLTDPDSTRLLSARVAVGNFQAGDVLEAVTRPGIIKQYDALTGILTLTGNSTLANFLAVLKTVKFRTTAAGGPARAIGFTVTDATGLASLEVTRTVNVV